MLSSSSQIDVKIGNILTSTENIIIHQVNHMGVMGAGLAKQLATIYPQMLHEYKNICVTVPYRIARLGFVYFYQASPSRIIANVFGQDRYGRDGCYTDYESLSNGLTSVRNFAERKGHSVAIPYGIGCGLAGGNWDIVSEIIDKVFIDFPDIVMYKLP